MPLSPQQVEDLKPVQYEWDMLVEAAEHLGRIQESKKGKSEQENVEATILENLVLEAFVVHFRQLGHFFIKQYKSDTDTDDIRVKHFTGVVWARPTNWGDLLKRANRQVAHLTAERHFRPNQPQKQNWPITQIVQEMSAELAEFCRLTGFAGFQRVSVAPVGVASQGARVLPIVDGMATATNAPITCNSVAISPAVSTTTTTTSSTK